MTLESEFYREVEVTEKAKINTYLVKVIKKVESEKSEDFSVDEDESR